jgi:hypothetical protein
MALAQKPVGICSHFLTFSLAHTITHCHCLCFPQQCTERFLGLVRPMQRPSPSAMTLLPSRVSFRTTPDAQSRHLTPPFITIDRLGGRNTYSWTTGKCVAQEPRSIQCPHRLPPLGKRFRRDNDEEDTSGGSDEEVCNENRHLDASFEIAVSTHSRFSCCLSLFYSHPWFLHRRR